MIALLASFVWLGSVAAKTFWIEVRAVRPPRRAVSRADPALAEFQVGDVTIESRDGVRLSAWHIPTRNGAAIALVHGYGANRQELVPEAALFARRGYGVLLLDARAHGASGGDRTTYGDVERHDLRAAVSFLAAQPAAVPGGIGLLGFSVGASMVALAAAEDPRVAAVALEAPTTSIRDACWDEGGRMAWLKGPACVAALYALGIDVPTVAPSAAVRALSPRALLVVHGEQDSVIPTARGLAVYAAAQQPKVLKIIRSAGHGDYYAADPIQYARTLISFFGRHLRARAVAAGVAHAPE